MQPRTGLEGAFFEHRERLVRFLAARGAGDAAEDLLQEVWLKISTSQTGPIASPLPYLYRVADTLMIDRFRSQRQALRRDKAWTELSGGPEAGISDAPSADRSIAARDFVRLVEELLARLEPPRIAEVFRRHRIDGVPQRQVAAEFGISLSTVESDLRTAYRALADLKERHDEA
ncbi:sigma-70 family RNA polymerase sigma factor [Altererythrobacter salegens]|uniref:Sigma-70 family RNA polymerase sigma factor n=2 Tax=Croceibacterium salegens TaxID=1737568 RepID=A0A6I4T377_9SPHN|nr:sigma-70 family RNA polymerase sigma factor [Croceibacterium salegens]